MESIKPKWQKRCELKEKRKKSMRWMGIFKLSQENGTLLIVTIVVMIIIIQ